uniref:Putative secreted protein n=1 Tax=Amblyomma cajennense TaxID=34607 RepID=A0A023FB24_AMBCJ
MHFKAVLIGLAIFGFLMSEAIVTNAEAAAEARVEAVAVERVEEGPQEADGRIDPTILGSMVGGGVR